MAPRYPSHAQQGRDYVRRSTFDKKIEQLMTRLERKLAVMEVRITRIAESQRLLTERIYGPGDQGGNPPFPRN